jgi:hypothetical protein
MGKESKQVTKMLIFGRYFFGATSQSVEYNFHIPRDRTKKKESTTHTPTFLEMANQIIGRKSN